MILEKQYEPFQAIIFIVEYFNKIIHIKAFTESEERIGKCITDGKKSKYLKLERKLRISIGYG